MFRALDDKATAIINTLASGAGLFTLGTLAGVASAKVPTIVVWCALPSMGCAVVAIVLATLARRPREVPPPGSADQAARVAEACGAEGVNAASGVMLAQWNLLAAMFREPNAHKTWYLDRANWFFVASVSLLLLPLAVSLIVGAPPAPPSAPASS